jgi:hypothetical protein
MVEMGKHSQRELQQPSVGETMLYRRMSQLLLQYQMMEHQMVEHQLLRRRQRVRMKPRLPRFQMETTRMSPRRSLPVVNKMTIRMTLSQLELPLDTYRTTRRFLQPEPPPPRAIMMHPRVLIMEMMLQRLLLWLPLHLQRLMMKTMIAPRIIRIWKKKRPKNQSPMFLWMTIPSRMNLLLLNRGFSLAKVQNKWHMIKMS